MCKTASQQRGLAQRVCQHVQDQHLTKEGLPNEDQHGQHKDGNLNGRPESYSNSQVHFVLVSHQHSCDVLTGVASNGQDDQSQEGLAQAGFGAHI